MFFVVENCQLVSFCLYLSVYYFSVESPSCFGLCLLIESLFPGFFPGTLYGRNVGRQRANATLSTVFCPSLSANPPPPPPFSIDKGQAWVETCIEKKRFVVL